MSRAELDDKADRVMEVIRSMRGNRILGIADIAMRTHFTKDVVMRRLRALMRDGLVIEVWRGERGPWYAPSTCKVRGGESWSVTT